MNRGYLRGHPIIFLPSEDVWVFEDTKEPTEGSWEERSCCECGSMPTEDSHDACIKGLPGVLNACCGHGKEKGYIQFEDGRIVRGYFNVEDY